ncbi:MAG TPA: Smr/MutS family protein [Burkholderiaceae bacterium]|nr:Smr/MutS family protein [Burkholderiaceae bacterium]
MGAFDQLKTIREQLHAQRVEEENRRKRAALEAQRDAARERLFRDAVKDATPLPASNRVVNRAPLPAPQARQRELDEQQVLADAFSDEFGLEQMLETDEQLSWRREGIGNDVLGKLRRGHWSIQAQLDLHGHRVDEAREELAEFLRDALRAGLRCVRVVHGKGLGSKDRQPVLKGKVRSWLMQKDEVIAFVAARPADGGGGALVVLLKPSSGSRGT